MHLTACVYNLWSVEHKYKCDCNVNVFGVNLFPCRRQFDLANQEAMDESAEWRRRFDFELEKAAKCSRELDKVRALCDS